MVANTSELDPMVMPKSRSDALMRFDPKRLAKQRKKKQDSSSLSSAKRRKEKDAAASTSASPQSAPAFASEMLVINATPVSTLPSPTSSPISRRYRQSTEVVHLPSKEPVTHPRSGSTTTLLRSTPSIALISALAHQSRPFGGSKVLEVDPSSTSTSKVELAQAFLYDMLTLSRDFLFAIMLQRDLNSCRRDLGPEQLVNMASATFWIQGLSEGGGGKVARETKVTKELKKQLQEKLAIIKEKHKALMDHQRKVNEGEKRLLELQQEVSKIPELKTKVKKLEEIMSFRDNTMATQDKALLMY
ncbi:hypothetical protein COCNU_01G017760 [Cocos nucifera]|uniref:Uncharacterized protein n=1 Tax=Cocos nucifera TaxID=13894 RepID=A0A8K0HWB5_COCNU|nr:hypothetical protein COCNU_01G017760 [Cocos nucifera]